MARGILSDLSEKGFGGGLKRAKGSGSLVNVRPREDAVIIEMESEPSRGASSGLSFGPDNTRDELRCFVISICLLWKPFKKRCGSLGVSAYYNC